MDSSSIRSLYAYNTWANERLFATAQALSPQQFVAPLHASFGSIHAVLLHLVTAQRNWLARVRRVKLPAELPPAASETIGALHATWQQADKEMHDFVDQVTDEELAEVVHYVNFAGQPNAYPRWQMLFHQATHAAQHRSEVALLLTQLGYSTGELDYLRFLDDIGQNLADSQ